MIHLKRILALSSIASASPIIEFASRMGRTIVLSHLLSPSEFGVSVAITVLLASSELITDISLDKFLMSQAGDDARRALSAVHWLMVLRGIILAAVVFAIAPWMAQFLGAPDSVAAFQWVAVILVIRAFAHFEIRQALRDFRYGRDAFASVVAQLAALAAIYPAALGFRDYRAMVLSLMIEAIVYVAASHLLAQLRYSATSNERKILRQALAFGLPLTLNGLGLAMLSQFDRALVSHWLGIQTLALYAVTLSLAVVPISLIFRIVSTLGMSFLVRARRDGGDEADAFPFMVWVFAVIGAAYSVFVSATLDFIMPLIYGPHYTVSPLTHMLMTIIVWFRLQRGGAPTGLIIVKGDTRWLMMGNLIGGCGLILGGVFLIIRPNLDIFLMGVLVGDLMSLAALFWATYRLINRRSSLALEQLLWSFAAAVMASFCVSPLFTQALLWRFTILGVAALIVAAQFIYGFQSRLVYRALHK